MNDDWDTGYAAGLESGYESAYADSKKEIYEEALQTGRDEGYTDGYDKGFAQGVETENTRMESEISDLRYNYIQRLEDSNFIIKCLKEEIYKLRKEHATITRTLQQST